VQVNPTAPPLPKESDLWTDDEIGLFFRSGGLLKPLISPWAQGKKAGSPLPAKKPLADLMQVPEVVDRFVNEVPRRLDTAYASPAEYATAVLAHGHHERHAAATIIPHEDPWLQQLQSTSHLEPFESHRIAFCGEVEASSHSSWVSSADPALARGVDFRLWKDSLSHQVHGIVRFGPDATLQSPIAEVANLVVTAAVQMALGEAAEEAVKLQLATVVTQKEFSMSVISPLQTGVTYSLQASVTGAEGITIHTSASMSTTSGEELQKVAIAAVDFSKLA